MRQIIQNPYIVCEDVSTGRISITSYETLSKVNFQIISSSKSQNWNPIS